jgi:DNA polymerase-3 subunit beta
MMQIRCDRFELAESLGDILGIVPPTQPVKPILVNCHLKTVHGRLEVTVTDLDMGARVRLERVEVSGEGELALPATRFYSIVREVPEKHIVLEGLPDGQGAVVRANGYEFKILGQDPREFPEVSAFSPENALSIPREKFVEMLRRVAVAASRDATRYQLTGVFFEVQGEKLLLTATDGKRLTHDHLRIDNEKGFEGSAIVPNRVVDVLLKLLSQGEPSFSFSMGDPNVHIGFNRGELTAKAIQGTFPDYSAAVGLKANIRVAAKRNDFLTAARSASLMTDKNTATILFRFEDGKAVLTTQALEIGESKIEVPISLQGEPVQVRFNPVYFIDALRCLTDEEVRLEFVDEEKACTVRGAQHYKHLVMPLVTTPTR